MSKRRLTDAEANILISELAEGDLSGLSYGNLASRFLSRRVSTYQGWNDKALIDEYISRHNSLPFDYEGEI
jgi:hypothetical protein